MHNWLIMAVLIKTQSIFSRASFSVKLLAVRLELTGKNWTY